MAKLEIGYLFKKRYITYQDTNYEVYKFIDYVAGITFHNNYKRMCNVITGEKHMF